MEYDIINQNYDMMDYYDNTGDLLSAYYKKRDNDDSAQKGSKSIFDFLNTFLSSIKKFYLFVTSIFIFVFCSSNQTVTNLFQIFHSHFHQNIL